jgi:hypothetical protein
MVYYSHYIFNHLYSLLNSDEVQFYFTKETDDSEDFKIKIICDTKQNLKDITSLILDVFSFDLKDFKDKLGVNKDSFDKLALKKCGRKPLFKSKMASYKKCVESLANGISSKIKNEVRQEISSAPVSVKNEINNERQKSFAKEITNRSSGGIYGGERWDGESNAYVENLVDKGLV